jgi:Sulfotransferase family
MPDQPPAPGRAVVTVGDTEIATDQLVFVGGMHRSGTTPLADLLAEHDDISGLSSTSVKMDEGQHLQDVYPRTRSGMGRFALEPGAHLTEESHLVSPQNAQRLLSAWAPYWDLRSRLLLEKTPRNLVMGRFLQALFPGSALIVVVRHPIVVSLAMEKWNPLITRKGRLHVSLSTQLKNWTTAHRQLVDDMAHRDRVLVLRYEDLLRDTPAYLEKVRTFLGLDSPFEVTPLDRNRSKGYEAEWQRRQGSKAPWVQGPIRLAAHAHADEIARYGYDFADLGALGDPDPSIPLA